MCGEQGFIAVQETVHLVKFIGKGWSIFFSSAYVTLLRTTGYKVQVLTYWSRCAFHSPAPYEGDLGWDKGPVDNPRWRQN